MTQFKPQKGKAYDKLPRKTIECFNNTIYYISTKYDGNQVFISIEAGKARFFTSDWKEFGLPTIAKALSNIKTNMVLIGEMLYDSDGRLGARTKVQGKITTERVNFKKGLPCSLDEDKVTIILFDMLVIGSDNIPIVELDTSGRYFNLNTLSKSLPKQLQVIQPIVLSGKDAQGYAKELVKDGWEGVMLIEPEQPYFRGKRVNHAIKLKYRPTADLLCINVTEGEGKYTGQIGALVLKDSKGRVVQVGSGLDDNDRLNISSYYIGKVIEIEYEQIMDTYQQPTFVCIRNDKTKEDID